MFKGVDGPVLLIVLDGVGEVNRELGNAVKQAHTPVWDAIRAEHRFTTLQAHGISVGLPSDKDMGNSEVGHNALGAGQIYDQGAKLVGEALDDKSMFDTSVWRAALSRVKAHEKTLHFLGLLSDGNVHSHMNHLLTMLERASDEGVHRIRIHVLLDGRDVGGVTAHIYLSQLESALADLNRRGRDYRIASGGGRMKVTMDRYEAEWDMVERGWKLHVLGQGPSFKSARDAVLDAREKHTGILDQDLPGFVIADENGPVGPMEDGDSVILFNFRGDRAIEISRAFDEGDEFDGFERVRKPDVFYAGMMQYDGDLHCPRNYLVGPPKIVNTLTDYLVEAKIHQYAISETQKYGHVTYFWNGNRSGMMDKSSETYLEIPSDTVPFDERPWMKAAEITDALILALCSGQHRFLRVNYPNGDMVGHTGNLQAAITAMACLDLQLRRLLAAVDRVGGVAIITADHGNCDEMFELDKHGKALLDDLGKHKAKTSHTLSPVPFVLYDPGKKVPGDLHRSAELGLGNVASTVAQLVGLDAPGIWNPSLLNLNY